MGLFGSLLAGILATFMMDVLAISLLRKKVFHLGDLQIVPSLLGRWIFHLKRCNVFIQKDIRSYPVQSFEVRIGMLLHYLIGAVLGVVFWIFISKTELAPIEVLLGGTLFGLFTNALPWFLMYPSMGFGFFGKRLAVWKDLVKFSFINHLVYGLFLGAFVVGIGWLQKSI